MIGQFLFNYLCSDQSEGWKCLILFRPNQGVLHRRDREATGDKDHRAQKSSKHRRCKEYKPLYGLGCGDNSGQGQQMEREKNQEECTYQEEKDLQHGLGVPPEYSAELPNQACRGLNIFIHLIGQNIVKQKLTNHCSLCLSPFLLFSCSFVCLTKPVMGETLH